MKDGEDHDAVGGGFEVDPIGESCDGRAPDPVDAAPIDATFDAGARDVAVPPVDAAIDASPPDAAGTYL